MSENTGVTKVFVTGDRRMDPLVAPLVLAKAFQRLQKKYGKVEIYTGAFETGVERAVRYLVPQVNVLLHSDNEDGTPNLDAFHKTVSETVDVALMVHGDPLGSKIGKSLAGHFAGDRLLFV